MKQQIHQNSPDPLKPFSLAPTQAFGSASPLCVPLKPQPRVCSTPPKQQELPEGAPPW